MQEATQDAELVATHLTPSLLLSERGVSSKPTFSSTASTELPLP